MYQKTVTIKLGRIIDINDISEARLKAMKVIARIAFESKLETEYIESKLILKNLLVLIFLWFFFYAVVISL